MANRRRAFVLMAGILAASIPPPASGQEKPPPEEVRRLTERWKREAAEYRIQNGPQALILREEPVLRWSNPVRETDDGLILLWLERGRPAAIACFYRVRWQGRLTEAHEFHSLAPSGLTATLKGGTVWAPTGAGVEPRPIPGAPRPAATPAERLRQMQALARQFRATVDKSSSELRMLSRPIYRFEEGDGALFAFVLTTDPEALLMIESRPGADGPRWHYSFARMTDHSLKARHRDDVVWEAPPIPGDKGIDNPYCVRWDVGPR